jgi:hypothetical protein
LTLSSAWRRERTATTHKTPAMTVTSPAAAVAGSWATDRSAYAMSDPNAIIGKIQQPTVARPDPARVRLRSDIVSA